MSSAVKLLNALRLPLRRLSLSQVSALNRCYSSDSADDGIKRENLPISRFPIPQRDTLPTNVQERMDSVEEKAGFLPNVFKALSYHPKEFDAFFNYYDVLMEEKTGSLSKAEKELIVVATSARNNCLYCVVAHSALHRIYSKHPYLADQAATNQEFADMTSRERTITEFAMKVSQMEALGEADFARLEKEGLSSDDAWYIGAIAAFFSLSNRMAHLAAMRPNEQFYAMGRGTKKQ